MIPHMPRRTVAPPAHRQTERSQLFIGAVERGLQVLQAFRDNHRQMSIAEISRVTGLDRSATQRLVHTLEQLDFLRRVPDTQQFGLSPKVMDLSYNFLRSREIVERASPYLLELSRSIDETANLQELDGCDIVFLARFHGRHLLNVDTAVGYRLPALFTASGRAILSKLTVAERRQVIESSRLDPVTPYTETDPRKLLADIEEAGRKGYAVVINQTVVGDISVASPITDHHGRPVAAVNISVPTTRWTAEKAEEQLVPHVLLAATSLSKRVKT